MKKAVFVVLCVVFLFSYLYAGEVPGEKLPALASPNGLTMDLVNGFRSWRLVSGHVRVDKKEMHLIWGNDSAMQAIRKAGSGEPLFEKGSILVKVGYRMKKNPDFTDSVEPAQLQRVEFMYKDALRFAGTGGWGYARFPYDVRSGSFSVYGVDADFALECFRCHSRVKGSDYVFTRSIGYVAGVDTAGLSLVPEAGAAGSFATWKLHPLLNILAFMVLAAGMFIAREMKRKSWWMKAHALVQTAGIAILAGGITVMASVMGPGHSAVPHAYAGMTAFILLIVTLCGGVLAFRVPSMGMTIRRIHRWAGRLSLALMCIIIILAIVQFL